MSFQIMVLNVLLYSKRSLQFIAFALNALLSYIVLFIFFTIAAVNAQDGTISVDNAPIVAEPSVLQLENVADILKEQESVLVKLNEEFQNKKNDDSVLLDIRQKLQSLASDALREALNLRQPLLNINLKLDQLGIAPAGGDELQTKTDERKLLLEQKLTINKQVGDFENIYVSANVLISKIGDKRRELFTSSLTQRVVFDKVFFQNVAASINDSAFAISRIFSNYAVWVIQNKLASFSFALMAALIGGVIVMVIGRRLSNKVKQAIYCDASGVGYLRRILVALLTSTTVTVAVLVGFEIFAYIFTFSVKFPDDIVVIFNATQRFVFLVVLISSIARALFSPQTKDLALVDITPMAAKKLIFLLSAIAVIFGLNVLFDNAYQIVEAPFSLAIAKDFTSIFLIGLLIILVAFVRPGKHEPSCQFVPFPWFIRFIIIFAGAIPFLLAAFGYVGMGRFIIQQLVVGFAFLILIYLGLSISRTLTQENVFAQTHIGKAIAKNLKLGHVALDQLGLLAGILTGVLVLLLCLPPILMQFGFTDNEIFAALSQLLTGFQIGNVSVSLIGLAIGISFFLGVYALFRWFISCFDNIILARSHVDIGIRNSVKTIAGYGAMAIAAMVGMSAAGLNLSSLALIAGGLSLGIGFGLQNIVQNFVSGLILLAERPFKVGDYVETGTVQGTVRRISVRATEIETGQKNTIIVPNSSLINGNVGNWTLRNKTGRVDLTFTIPLAFKPEEVTEKLLAIAKSVGAISRKPEPSVEFVSFDDAGLVFKLNVYVPDITSTTAIKNKIRIEVFNEFYATWSKAIQAWEDRNFRQYHDDSEDYNFDEKPCDKAEKHNITAKNKGADNAK